MQEIEKQNAANPGGKVTEVELIIQLFQKGTGGVMHQINSMCTACADKILTTALSTLIDPRRMYFSDLVRICRE